MKVNPVTITESINKRKGNAMRWKEIAKKYFPKEAENVKVEAMTPYDRGKYCASKAMVEAFKKQNAKEPLNAVIERKVDLYA